VGDYLGVRARIGGVHDDLRRHDLRILADRQLEERQQARDGDERRDDPGEDRAVDEEVRQLHGWAPLSVALEPFLARRVARSPPGGGSPLVDRTHRIPFYATGHWGSSL